MKLIDYNVPGPRREYVGYGRDVPQVSWPDGARIAVSIVLNWEEGSEYSVPAGDRENEGLAELQYDMESGYRDLCVESVYEYGSRAGIWRLQRLLDEYQLPTTFFGCAVAFERNPEVASWLREAGHEPCCHGWRWEEVWRLTRDEERAHMEAAVRSIEESCGQRPQGWYCRYGPSVNTRELVVEEGGFVYDSDAYNDDLPYYTEVLGQRHPSPSVQPDIQRHQVRYSTRLLRPHLVRRLLQARVRLSLGGGRNASEDDVDRPASAAHRPSGAHVGPQRVS